MARGSQQAFQKRQKEKARQQRQKDKEAQRLAAKQQRIDEGGGRDDGEDPDLAGIRPGPQPLPEQWDYAGGNVPAVAADDEAAEGEGDKA